MDGRRKDSSCAILLQERGADLQEKRPRESAVVGSTSLEVGLGLGMFGMKRRPLFSVIVVHCLLFEMA